MDDRLDTLEDAMALSAQIEQEAPEWKVARCTRYGRWYEVMIYTKDRVLYVDGLEDWAAIRKRYLP